MDTDEPTVNGALQPTQQTNSLLSYTPAARLKPTPPEDIIKELASVLALVAPSGFSAGDRKTWLVAAAKTLEGIPADLLRDAVANARRSCDHPSKIVPFIFSDIGEAWKARKTSYVERLDVPALPPPAQPDFVPCTPEQAAEIMKEFGLTKNPLIG